MTTRWLGMFALASACSDPAAASSDASSSGDDPLPTTSSGDASASSSDATSSIADTSGTVSSEAVPDIPTPACGPSGGGPHWLLEGESIEVNVVCTSGTMLPGDAFVIDPLPDGATYDPVTATMAWTPALDQAAVYELTVSTPQTGESAIVKIGIADRWDAPDNVPVVDPLIYTEEYGLPVLHLQVSPEINDGAYTPATTIYRGHTYTMEAKYRGAASLGYPKKSFTLEFSKDDKFNEPQLAGGFEDKRKIVLISTFDDNAYVRQRLAYELWNTSTRSTCRSRSTPVWCFSTVRTTACTRSPITSMAGSWRITGSTRRATCTRPARTTRTSVSSTSRPRTTV